MNQALSCGFALLQLGFLAAAQTTQSPPPLPSADEVIKQQNQVYKAFLEKTSLDASTEPKSTINAKRERLDALNTLWFTAPGKSLQLNLFTDAQYTVLVDRFEMLDGVSIFYCHVQDHEERPVILSYQSGVLAARIPTPSNQAFQISFDGNGLHRIIEIDESVPICGLGDGGAPVAAVESVSQDTAPAAPLTGQPAVVDVMVLYTTEAKNAYGGLSGINTTIALGLAYMNCAFNRSGINAKVRLVHKAETTWHTQSASASEELSWLRIDSTVADLRDQYGADLVSVTTTLGGIAYCSALCPLSFSVVTSDPRTFAHELGHNFGCDHDRLNRGGCTCDSCYAYGYSFTTSWATYGTIMSYVGSAIENYSSPLVYFGGVPTGLPEGHLDAQGRPDSADNARNINEKAVILAACKSTAITVLDSQALINNDTQFTFNITGPNNGTYTVDYTSDYLSWTFLGNYSLSSGSVAVTDTIGSTTKRFYRAKLGTASLGTQVGFIKKSVPAGQSMIANQLDNADNTVGALLPGMPPGTILYKWDESAQQFVSNTYFDNQWWGPSMTLHPGEGVILSIAESRTLNFVGQVRDAFNIDVVRLQAIRSSPVPQAGAISSVLLFPGGSLGDTVSKMTSPSGSYTTYTYSGHDTTWTPSEPSFDVGESFWSNKPNLTQLWRRVLWTWP